MGNTGGEISASCTPGARQAEERGSRKGSQKVPRLSGY